MPRQPATLPPVVPSDGAVPLEEAPKAKRMLEVIRTDGTQFKLVVDKEDKLTFGPAIPGGKGAGYAGHPSVNEYALRIYRGNKETGLKACFPGVREFRETGDDGVQVIPW